jgi:hypothetical protein
MSKISTLTKTAIISAFAATAFIATPAMAASNGDVEKCRAAFSEQGEMNMDDYRLRFERQDGQRTKTIHFKAIPHDGGEALDVTCTLRRTKVLSVNAGNGEVTLMAKNEKK